VHARSTRRRLLGKINDPDHGGEIQSNHRVDLTQPRALAQRISVAHISAQRSRSTNLDTSLPPDFAFGPFLSGSSSNRTATSRRLAEKESVNYDRNKC